MKTSTSEVVDSTLRLRHSSVYSRLEIPHNFDPVIGLLIIMFPGLGAPGEVYEEVQHHIAQKSGNAVLTMTWGRDFDLHYLTHIRKEHSHQAVAAAENADKVLGGVTKKVLYCHSNGGGDGSEEVEFSVLNGRGGQVIGVDFEAVVGTAGTQIMNGKDMLGATAQSLAAIKGSRGRKIGRLSAKFSAANPLLLIAEAAAAVRADIRPHMQLMDKHGIAYVNNIYNGDAVVPPNREAAHVRVNDGDHFTPIEPDVAYDNVLDLTSRINDQSVPALLQCEDARAS